jgi:hypothetical protein
LSQLSSPILVAAVSVRYITTATSLLLFSSLELLFVESVIELNRELDYSIELFRSVDPYKFILNIFLESTLEELDIGVFVKVKVQDNLLEFGSIYAS